MSFLQDLVNDFRAKVADQEEKKAERKAAIERRPEPNTYSQGVDIQHQVDDVRRTIAPDTEDTWYKENVLGEKPYIEIEPLEAFSDEEKWESAGRGSLLGGDDQQEYEIALREYDKLSKNADRFQEMVDMWTLEDDWRKRKKIVEDYANKYGFNNVNTLSGWMDYLGSFDETDQYGGFEDVNYDILARLAQGNRVKKAINSYLNYGAGKNKV